MSGCMLTRLVHLGTSTCHRRHTLTSLQRVRQAAGLCVIRQYHRSRPQSESVFARLMSALKPLKAWGGLWSPARRRHCCHLALGASWFSILSVQSECDQVDFDLLVKNKIVDEAEQQTGWERLTAMYSIDELGLTPELEFVSSIGISGFLFGGALGSILHSNVAIRNFIEKNQATAFESPIVAKRALQDRVFISMLRGFFVFGWRIAVFSTTFALVSTSLMVYTNRMSALQYGAAGAAAGGLYKLSLGPRGVLAGAVGGALLGVTGGAVISLLCWLSGTSLPEVRAQQYIWKYEQQRRRVERTERRRLQRAKDAEDKLEETEPGGAEPAIWSWLRQPRLTADAQDAAPAAAVQGAPPAAAGASHCSGQTDSMQSVPAARTSEEGNPPPLRIPPHQAS